MGKQQLQNLQLSEWVGWEVQDPEVDVYDENNHN